MIASQKSVSNVEWDGAGVPEAPTAPETLKQAGLMEIRFGFDYEGTKIL